MDSGLNQDELRKLQLTALDILLEVKRICDKHDIKYSLAYGTLLGAVRHQGYIPWDDDTDVIMSRSEYNRFISICESELNTRYYLYSVHEFENRVRVCDKFTHCIEKGFRGEIVECDLWVDVYVYDNVNNISFDKFITVYIINTIICAYYLKSGVYDASSVFGHLLKFISLFIPFKVLRILLKNMSEIGVKQDTDFAVNRLLYAWGDNKFAYPLRQMSSFVIMKFEGYDFSCIADYDAHLRHIYGDYMVPMVTHTHVMRVIYDSNLPNR